MAKTTGGLFFVQSANELGLIVVGPTSATQLVSSSQTAGSPPVSPSCSGLPYGNVFVLDHVTPATGITVTTEDESGKPISRGIVLGLHGPGSSAVGSMNAV